MDQVTYQFRVFTYCTNDRILDTLCNGLALLKSLQCWQRWEEAENDQQQTESDSFTAVMGASFTLHSGRPEGLSWRKIILEKT